MTAPLLETRSLAVNFGGLAAVDGIDFTLPKAQLRCVIGPNGAGKTTLFNLLTGRLRPSRGEVRFKDTNITRWATHRRIRHGMSRTFQISNLYDRLSVDENVRLAAQRVHEPFHPLRRRELLPGLDEDVQKVLEQVGLGDRRWISAGNLAHGEKRKLELGVAIALEPTLLLLDEPTAGLNNLETMEMARLVKAVAAYTTILVIEHDMDFVREIADLITVLNRGRILAEGRPEEIEANADVRAVYLEGVGE